ncbi:hypothetical protein ABZ806_22185 [Spirillospora sp. NPDC047418]
MVAVGPPLRVGQQPGDLPLVVAAGPPARPCRSYLRARSSRAPASP